MISGRYIYHNGVASSNDGFANAVNVRLGLWEKTRDLNVDSREIEDVDFLAGTRYIANSITG